MSEFLNESFMYAQVLLRLISKETWCTRAQSLIILARSNNNSHAKVIKYPSRLSSPPFQTHRNKSCVEGQNILQRN